MIMKANGRLKNYKLNKGKLVSRLAVLSAMLFMTSMCINFCKYPEQYLTTWKYQLENDLIKGKQDAIDYYNATYVANGKQLFGDKYIVENN